MPSLLEMVEQKTMTIEPAQREAIVVRAMQAVSGQFPPQVLRRPTSAQRAEIMETAKVQLARELRQAGLTHLDGQTEADMLAEMERRMLGLGFLELLLRRRDITEIAMTSDGQLWVKPKTGARFVPAGIQAPPAPEVFRVIDVLLGPQGRSLTDTTPTVSARLPKTEFNPGGGRVKVIHPLLSGDQGEYPSLNIRLFESRPVPPQQLLDWGVCSGELLEDLGEAVRRYLRLMIVGGTGTGKTTILSALCNYIAKEDRIVLIEDPAEIYIDHPHVQRLEARVVPVGSEALPYSLRDGVDDAMRMTPDWLVVGEVRTGDAALSLFRAQMSDHAGMSTFHSESPAAAVRRLEAILLADAHVAPEATRRFLAMAVDLLVILGYDQAGKRRIVEVAQVERELTEGEVGFTPIWRYDGSAWQRLGRITRSRK